MQGAEDAHKLSNRHACCAKFTNQSKRYNEASKANAAGAEREKRHQARR